MYPRLDAYLEFYCNSRFSRGFVDLNKMSSAGHNIGSQSKTKGLSIALPPRKEQMKIVEMVERSLSVADEIEKELDHALARSERLRQSILKQAFEGRLM